MNIIDYYNQRCKESGWYDKYFSCSEAGEGSIYKFFGTNYRNLNLFEYYFNAFKPYIGLPRNKWPKKDTTGQEIAKQYVVNLVESFLYMSHREENELVYNLTLRGKDFEKMLSKGFTEDEKILLVYIYLMNASFKKTPRYILKKSKTVWEKLNNNGFDDDYLNLEIRKLLLEQKNKKAIKNIFKYDIVWLISFYSDVEFLKMYKISSKEEIEELKNLSVQHYDLKIETDVLTWKYKSTNFSKPTLFHSLIMLYLSNIVNAFDLTDIYFEKFFQTIVEEYSKVYTVDKEKVLKYIYDNKSIFMVMYKNAISKEDDFTERYVPEARIDEKQPIPKEKIDATSEEGIQKLEAVRSVLKKLAKDKSNYKCALHDLNSCRYFTSKEENKNYLEIHHLIPREFSYNFEDTIEFVENYVPLCPRCHRMIHKAVDRERIALINYLFNKRKIDLENHNLKIDINELYEFYKIDKDKC